MPRAAQYLLAGLLALCALTPLALALGTSLNPDNTDELANMGSWRALGLLALCVLTPLALALGTSLNPDNTDELANMGSWRALWPREIGLDNYWAMWGDPFHPCPRHPLNTASIAVVGAVALATRAALKRI